MQIQLSKKQFRDLFIEGETSCSLCGTELKHKHKVDFIKQEVTEEQVCPSCGIRSKKKNHALQ